jgi:hypothetical protein
VVPRTLTVVVDGVAVVGLDGPAVVDVVDDDVVDDDVVVVEVVDVDVVVDEVGVLQLVLVMVRLVEAVAGAPLESLPVATTMFGPTGALLGTVIEPENAPLLSVETFPRLVPGVCSDKATVLLAFQFAPLTPTVALQVAELARSCTVGAEGG